MQFDSYEMSKKQSHYFTNQQVDTTRRASVAKSSKEWPPAAEVRGSSLGI